MRAKPVGDLYFKGDTHWNRHGAYFGYFEIAEKIKDLFPKTHVLTRDEFEISEIQIPERAPWCDLSRSIILLWARTCSDVTYQHKNSKLQDLDSLTPPAWDFRGFKDDDDLRLYYPYGEWGQGWGGLKVLNPDFPWESYGGVFARTSRVESPSVLLLGDSFADSIAQLFAESSSWTYSLVGYNGVEMLSFSDDGKLKGKKFLEALKPEVVVYVTVQRQWEVMFP